MSQSTSNVIGLTGLILFLFAPATPAQRKPVLATVLPSAEARKVVQQITWQRKEGRFGFRPVSPQEVAHLEANLPAFAKTVRMPSWSRKTSPVDITTCIRQYAGVTQHGRKLIYVNGFDRGFLTLFHGHVPDWHTRAFVIADGGTGVYRATYDPQARRFTDFMFNGPA